MIIGEGPGYNEDQEGRPFVGPAGQYLDKWLDAIGLVRGSNVWIGNVVKCRPPENRDPRPEESDACIPYLREQIALVRPRLIMTVGRISMRLLTGTTQGITRVHGSFYRYEGIPLVPTFHPSAVLRNPDYRRPVWEDLKKVRNWLIDNAGLDPGDGQE
jgi:uracil-DNA glycosylase family 4